MAVRQGPGWVRPAALGLGALAVVVRFSRHLGAQPTEVAADLPGDHLDAAASAVTTRAVTIDAPPAEVWPWLVQMGYDRGGWYAIDALERCIGAGRFLTGGSADRVLPELQGLAAGDLVPLTEHLALRVAHLDRDRALVLDLPRGPLAWVWAFTLHPLGAGHAGATAAAGATGAAGTARTRAEPGAPPGTATRLVVRTRIGARRWWVRPLVPLLEAGHLVMEMVQLHRLRRRIEATHRG